MLAIACHCVCMCTYVPIWRFSAEFLWVILCNFVCIFIFREHLEDNKPKRYYLRRNQNLSSYQHHHGQSQTHHGSMQPVPPGIHTSRRASSNLNRSNTGQPGLHPTTTMTEHLVAWKACCETTAGKDQNNGLVGINKQQCLQQNDPRTQSLQ